VTPAAAGRRVLITRRWPDLAAGLAAAGLTSVEIPTIEVRPPVDERPFERALGVLSQYEWIVFTSQNAVEAVRSRMSALGLPMPAGLSAASVGPLTSAAILAAWPDLRLAVQPRDDFRGASLVEAFAGQELAGRRVLLPVSDRAAETVETGLAARGATIDRVVAYETGAAPGTRDLLLDELGRGVDAVAFASPSAVEAYAAAVGAAGAVVPAVAIGPTTAAAVEAAGLRLLGVAQAPTPDGLVRVLAGAWSLRPPPLTRKP
jgi:uroporphyrinogen-III synthase